MVDGGAGDRFAGIFADDFGILAGGQGVHIVQGAKDGLQGGEAMRKGNGQGIDAIFLILCVEIARIYHAPRCRIAAANNATNQSATCRIIDNLPEFLDMGRMQRLQTDKGAAIIVCGDLLQDARLAGMNAQRPFAIDGFAERRYLFDDCLVLRQIDGNHQQFDIVTGGKGGGIVAVIGHAVFFCGLLRFCHAAGGQSFQGKLFGQLAERRVMRHCRPAACGTQADNADVYGFHGASIYTVI